MRWLALFLLLPIAVTGQNTIGLPDIINFTKQEYRAGLQNWHIRQDKNGLIYIANNEGLLCYDGKYWKLYPLPNRTIVRSVEISSDNRIYVGGQDELGYFSPNQQGVLTYHSLIASLDEKDRAFGDVWEMQLLGNQLFCRTTSRIIKWSGETPTVYPCKLAWLFMGVCADKIYAQDSGVPLLVFDQGIWKPVPGAEKLPQQDIITALLPIRQTGTFLISTLKNGVFKSAGNTFFPVNSPAQEVFRKSRIYAATRVNDQYFGLATNEQGIFIIDENANIIQSFSKQDGLQHNNVLCLFTDAQGDLWLGLDNGVDFVAYNSPIKQINPFQLNASGYTSIIHHNRLYAGTSGNLYSIPLQNLQDLSFSKGNFEIVTNTAGQNWGMNVINDQLLLGHHEGIFQIQGTQATAISRQPGFWNFIPTQAVSPVREVLTGHYNGVSVLKYENGQFGLQQSVPNFNESSRFIALDASGNYWVSQPYHGVYRINPASHQITRYGMKDGMPTDLGNYVFQIRGEVVAATEKGIYRFNPGTNQFLPSDFYKKLIGETAIRYLKEDSKGNIWLVHQKSLSVIDMTGPQPIVIDFPELQNKLLSGFESVYPYNESNIFIGAEKGFFHLNYEKYKKMITPLRVRIAEVRIGQENDSLLFGGFNPALNELPLQPQNAAPSFAYKWKAIRFYYASTLSSSQPSLEYSCRLTGFEKSWSTWSNRTEKEYTNLPPGNYIFEVKVRNNLGNESPVSRFSFTVEAPWYKTKWAYAIYLMAFIGFLYRIIRRQQRKFNEQQQKHEEEQKQLSYIHDLEISKAETELVTLRNEKLEAEIGFKNAELANSAMHLVKKGELMSRIKSDLTHLMKNIDHPQSVQEIKKLIKTLNEDENLDQEWDSFTKHFDKVHSDFLIALKEKHPDITAGELKLCAYLRMNLTSKEIAQLLNISLRGVEIGRYRLRKKLQLPTETNLFDYLIGLQSSGSSEKNAG